MAVKKLFARAVLLTSLYPDTAWKQTLKCSGVPKNALTLAAAEDGIVTEKRFANSELEFAPRRYTVFDFIGSEDEQERFYVKDCTLYVDKEGGFWCLYSDDLYDV